MKLNNVLTVSKKTLALLLLGSITISCSTSSIVLPMSCPKDNKKCQRNLDAQTLSYIGQDKAAVQLMCSDPDLRDTIGEDCNSE